MLLGVSLSQTEFARADEEVRVRPVDVYISGFGGYSFPFKTDLTVPGVTLHDVKHDSSPSFGAKIGLWITAPRKTLGIDIGTEIDVTYFTPDIPRQVVSSSVGLASVTAPFALRATYFGINVLARYPMGVTPNFPNGRWFPYVGVGGGGQRLTFEAIGVTTEARQTAPAFQGLGGVKVFVTKHVAVFVEGKYTYASHTMKFETNGVIVHSDLTVNSVHGVGGLSVHF